MIQKLLRAFRQQEQQQQQQQNDDDDDDFNFILDTFIFQFPSGHVDMAKLEVQNLVDVVQAASKLFNAKSVLFLTIAWNNNIPSNKVQLWKEKNELIRMFAANYTKQQQQQTSSSTRTVETVQVLDFATLSTNLIEANSKALGLDLDLSATNNDNDTDTTTRTYTLRLSSRWKNLVAHACGSMPFVDDTKGCLPNAFSVDGMHWCPETVHGRLNAGLVCILGCIHNHNHGQYFGGNTSNSSSSSGHHLKNSTTMCSNQCNSKYMSLEPFIFDRNGMKLVA